jgi:hypothetical protein
MSFTVTIAGLDVTNHVIQNSLTINRSLNNRGTCKLKIRDDTDTIHYDPGQEVYVYWSGTAIFGGPIESVDEELPREYGGPLFISLSCVDWSRLFDRFFVANAWDGLTVAAIVEKLVNDETPLGASEGITVGTVDAFTTTRVVFRYQKVSDCLRDLCNLAGFSWNISPTKVLSIQDRSTFTAPWTIGDAGGALKTYRDLKLKRDLSQYRNAQWIMAGKDTTDPRTEKFHGDTTTATASSRKRTFNLAYPVASITSITRESTAQRVGVRGTDDDGTITSPSASTWCQWFYAIDDTEISQNTYSDEVNNPTLTPNETLTVVYVGYYPIVDYEQDDAEIAARAAEENGSGIYQAVEEDEKCDTRVLAQEKADRLIAQFGRIPRVLKYEADVAGLLPGHLQTIAIADHDISSQFLVDQVVFTFPRVDYLRCQVTAFDGERQEGWVDFWRKSQLAGREFSIRANEVVIKAITPTETLTIADVLTDSENDTVVFPDTVTDPYSVAQIGIMTTVVGSEEIGLAVFGRSKIGEPYVVV